MRKAFGNSILAGSLLALGEQAAARSWPNSSPFVGEHRDARTIKHENGRVSSKMNTVRGNINKYESFIQRDGLFNSRSAKTDTGK